MINGLNKYKDRWNVSSESSIKPGLDAITQALRETGDPHLAVKTIHIAGTNGKGSTAAMLSNIFRTAGMKVGTFYSPAIHDLHDQIQIDGENISETDMDTIMQTIASIQTKLTDFELLTLSAFLAFRLQEVDIAVIEAGMGGRFDSTNVVVPEVAIIPSIAFEHADYLGPAIEDIAWHKGGIIKKWQPVVIGDLPAGAEAIIRGIADEMHSDLIRPETVNISTLSLKGRHQQHNAALAIAAAEEVLKFDFDPVKAVGAISATTLPFRFEQRYPGLILDGAHNEASARALVETIKAEYPGEKFRIVIGILKDKEYETVLRILEEVADEAVFVDFENNRALPADILFTKCNILLKTLLKDYDILPLTEDNRKTIVTGSLYLLSSLSDENSKFLQNYKRNASN